MTPKFTFTLTIIFSSIFAVYGQSAKVDSIRCTFPDSIMYVDVMGIAPKFPGGCDSLYNYIYKELNYPVSAKKDKIEGTVLVSFTVSQTGSIKEAFVLKGMREDLDKEALRIVMNMPKWIPGEYAGHKKNAILNIPIKFKLN